MANYEDMKKLLYQEMMQKDQKMAVFEQLLTEKNCGFLKYTAKDWEIKSGDWSAEQPKLETWHLPDDVTLKSVHAEGTCKGDYCLFHKPSSHHMSQWKLVYDLQTHADVPNFWRICPDHSIPHADPDAVYFLHEIVGLKEYVCCEHQGSCECCDEDAGYDYDPF